RSPERHEPRGHEAHEAVALLPRPLTGSVHGWSCGRPRRPRISPEGKVAVCTLAYAAPLCIASIISARPAPPTSMPCVGRAVTSASVRVPLMVCSPGPLGQAWGVGTREPAETGGP